MSAVPRRPRLLALPPDVRPSGRFSSSSPSSFRVRVRVRREKHGLRHLVRSHQMVEAGWEYIDCSGGYGVYTVFSAASYPNGSGYNAGAVLQLRPRDESPVALQFELATKEGCGEAEAAKLAQQSMIEIIVSHKGRWHLAHGCSVRAH
eukprot:3884636-Pleurochrysis_carterae.AAC.2